ncbi:MAG: sigma factor-like helix-turn-helix DNA-binding protein [bacterium]|nr:sigma factor-like helix-turn-helix DNA-binding protein [bacterium]
MNFAYPKVASSLVSGLGSRVRDIVSRRFGLAQENPETLEAIGSVHHITRERVRQIVQDTLRQIREEIEADRSSQAHGVFQYFSDTLRRAGSMKREDLLCDMLGARGAANPVVFLLVVGDEFFDHRETQDFYSFWSLKKEMVERASDFNQNLLSFFEKKEAPVQEEEIEALPYDVLRGKSLLSFLEASKHIMRSWDGKWGLRTWPEVNPRGIRDKAYLVLKRYEKPLHFTKVSKLIEEFQGEFLQNKEKRVLPQTVHNELIKDERFVLVGRGTYALSDWGYEPGTVKDVIMSLLRGNGGRMAKEDIMEKTLSQRQVKESTIELNLQDKSMFSRDPQGRYFIKA